MFVADRKGGAVMCVEFGVEHLLVGGLPVVDFEYGVMQREHRSLRTRQR